MFSGFEIIGEIIFNILGGMLLGPTPFVMSNPSMMDSISLGLVGLGLNTLGLGFFK